MSPKFNIKGEKTKQTTHSFNFIIFSKQNLAVLVSNLDQLPSQLTRVYRRSVLFYFLMIMGNISINQKSENLFPLLPDF